MSTQPMQDLPRNARFVGPDHVEYVITVPASEHPNGWVEVTPASGGEAGFFSYSHPTEVEVLP